jgi:hypothetical protein
MKRFLVVSFAFAACTAGGSRSQSQSLADSPGWDGSCPFEEVTQTHDYVIDATGAIVSDVTTTCKVCLDKDQKTPLGVPSCDSSTPPPTPPTPDPTTGGEYCSKSDTLADDPSGFECWVCKDDAGNVKEGCDFHKCAADGSCADGSLCDESTWLCGASKDPGPTPTPDPSTGGSEECKSVDSLASDPTGKDCYVCYDASGVETQEYCKLH